MGADAPAAGCGGTFFSLRAREAAVTSLEHPRPGERVAVDIDPAGLIELSHNAPHERDG